MLNTTSNDLEAHNVDIHRPALKAECCNSFVLRSAFVYVCAREREKVTCHNGPELSYARLRTDAKLKVWSVSAVR